MGFSALLQTHTLKHKHKQAHKIAQVEASSPPSSPSSMFPSHQSTVMNFSMNLALFGCFILAFLSGSSASSSSAGMFLQAGPTIHADDPAILALDQTDHPGPFAFGHIVEISKDGTRLAVGAPSTTKMSPGGAVFVYERDDKVERNHDVTQPTWRLVFELSDARVMGSSLALSDGGQVLAVRRRNGDVEVYRFDDSTRVYSAMGAPITNVCKGGKSLTLGRTSSNTDFGETIWLLISCELADRQRGKVEVMHFVEDQDKWTSFSTLVGPTSDEKPRFGWDTAFYPPQEAHQPLTIAVSSPHYDNKKGLVQTFRVHYSGWLQRLGQDLRGQNPGDQFGFSIAMSLVSGARTYPSLIVGAPSASIGDKTSAGCVSIYELGPVFYNDFRWKTVGEASCGAAKDESLGRSVSIADDGFRVAASSFRYDRQRGLVRLLEKDEASGNYQPIGTIEGDFQFSRFGQSVSMDRRGSTVVSGSPLSKTVDETLFGRSVQVFVEVVATANEPSASPGVLPSLPPSVAPSAVAGPTLKPNAASQDKDFFDLWNEDIIYGQGPDVLFEEERGSGSPSSAPKTSNDGPTNILSVSPSVAPTIFETVVVFEDEGFLVDEDTYFGGRMLIVGAASFLAVLVSGAVAIKKCYGTKEDTEPEEEEGEFQV